MLKKLITNEIRSSRLFSASMVVFMAVCAMMISLTVLLSTQLLSSMDRLMELAGTPDYLQMHAGAVDTEALSQFVRQHTEVKAWQTAGFLNLENGSLFLGESQLADSTQDNGLCVQGQGFDLLLDTENQMPQVTPGQVYVPVCYRLQYSLACGDSFQIGEEKLTIAGFLRDSQMNSMMASSRRFLVCDADYERLRPLGSEEYLIEFLLEDGTDTGVFAAAYAAAGLPANGPAITKALVRLMNALSDGILILVIFFVSLVVMAIVLLCIRFLLLTRLEQDRREIGMLKAVGIAAKDIRGLYFAKYIVLSAVGAVLGLLLALILQKPLTGQMRELYGTSDGGALLWCLTAAGVLLTEGLLLLAIRKMLRRTERVSAVEVLAGVPGQKRRGGWRQYLPVALAATAGMLLILFPCNLYSTLSSPAFVTYMGIGGAQLRLDIRQNVEAGKTAARAAQLLEEDKEVADYAVYVTRILQTQKKDGEKCNLMVETGDHTAFPVSYTDGRAPTGATELALSVLNAEELGLSVGDKITLSAGEDTWECTVCGIYSDITNGGKTAKACFAPQAAPVLWCICYADLVPDTDSGKWQSDCGALFAGEGIPAEIADIADYVQGTYGQTLSQVQLAAFVAAGIALLILLVVVVLFTGLLTEQDRSGISLKKALGFTTRSIRRQYLLRGMTAAASGAVAGILAEMLFGERLCGLLLRSLGADGFRFVTQWDKVFGLAALLLGTALLALEGGAAKIRKVEAYECCAGRE